MEKWGEIFEDWDKRVAVLKEIIEGFNKGMYTGPGGNNPPPPVPPSPAWP